MLVGWHFESGHGGPDAGGDGITYNQTVMGAELNEYTVYQNGSLKGSGANLLGGPPSDPLQVKSVIEQPLHGTLDDDPDTGDFVYVPDPNFVGRDWFTYQVKQTDPNTGDDIPGGFVTALLDVNPLKVSLSIGSYKAGDASATIPNRWNQIENPPTTALYLDLPTDLPGGSTVTLTLDDTRRVQAWSGLPSANGSVAVLSDQASTHTWTVGVDTIPQSLNLVGLKSTKKDAVHFEMEVVLAMKDMGGDMAAPPLGQALTATQAASGPTRAR